MFLKRFQIIFLPSKDWKKHPQKLVRKTQIHFFFLTANTAQMAQTEEIMFQNVAYRPTAYRTGVESKYNIAHYFSFWLLTTIVCRSLWIRVIKGKTLSKQKVMPKKFD